MTDFMNRPAGRHDEDGEPDLNALAAWVDGRLDSAGRAELADHLASCQSCRAIVAELTRGGAPAASSWAPVLAIAATIAVAAVAGTAYFLVHERQPNSVAAPILRPVTPAAAPKSTPSVAPPPAAPSSRSSPSSDRKRAAGTTQVAGKTFHLVAGEWIDNSYRETDFLPVVQVSSRQQLDSIAALQPYAALGSHFTVVIRGTVYQVALP